MTYADLTQISQIELIYKRKVKASERPKVTCSADAATLFRQNWNDCTISLYEEFKILLLDRSNHCMGIADISKGGVSGTVADPKLIFAAALKSRATSIILGHNHPSGYLTPSNADIEMTRKLIRAGQYLDLPVLDHLIITQESYYSMADNGIMPT